MFHKSKQRLCGLGRAGDAQFNIPGIYVPLTRIEWQQVQLIPKKNAQNHWHFVDLQFFVVNVLIWPKGENQSFSIARNTAPTPAFIFLGNSKFRKRFFLIHKNFLLLPSKDHGTVKMVFQRKLRLRYCFIYIYLSKHIDCLIDLDWRMD